MLHIIYMSPDSLSFASVSPLSSIHVMTVDDTLILLVSDVFVIIPYLSLSTAYVIPNLTLNLIFVG